MVKYLRMIFGPMTAFGLDIPTLGNVLDDMPRDAGQAQLIIALSDTQHIIQPLRVPHLPTRQRRRLGPVR